jgi:hypothetical protein
MSIETMLAMFKTGVSEVSRVRPSNDADLCETPERFHEVSRVSRHGAIGVRETSVTPKVSRAFQPMTTVLRACTRETSITPVPMNPGFKRPCRTLLRVEHRRFGRYRDRCPLTFNFNKKGNAS